MIQAWMAKNEAIIAKCLEEDSGSEIDGVDPECEFGDSSSSSSVSSDLESAGAEADKAEEGSVVDTETYEFMASVSGRNAGPFHRDTVGDTKEEENRQKLPLLPAGCNDPVAVRADLAAWLKSFLVGKSRDANSVKWLNLKANEYWSKFDTHSSGWSKTMLNNVTLLAVGDAMKVDKDEENLVYTANSTAVQQSKMWGGLTWKDYLLGRFNWLTRPSPEVKTAMCWAGLAAAGGLGYVAYRVINAHDPILQVGDWGIRYSRGDIDWALKIQRSLLANPYVGEMFRKLLAWYNPMNIAATWSTIAEYKMRELLGRTLYDMIKVSVTGAANCTDSFLLRNESQLPIVRPLIGLLTLTPSLSTFQRISVALLKRGGVVLVQLWLKI